jgi:ADP-ribose pyrophosphatase YjhB (NUDIX family)
VSTPLHEWTVAGGVVLQGEDVLLVRNVRRGGFEDWSTPGGVIDLADATLCAGLTREVAEETGLVVPEWRGPLYEVTAEAPDMGWRMRCEVHLAVTHKGELHIDDPDGIVVEASFCAPDLARERLGACPPWVREPLCEWLAERWDIAPAGAHRLYSYDVRGSNRAELTVERRPARRADPPS